MSDSDHKIIARLALEDGAIFIGEAFGDTSPKHVTGEACFNTSLCGYQEILTDPSYTGQIVTMTYPQIGNYGVSEADMESKAVGLSGFVVKEIEDKPSNFRSTSNLSHWLKDAGIPGIAGIDTRALTRKLRLDGAMKSVLSTVPESEVSHEALVEMARNSEGLVGKNLARQVSRDKTQVWSENLGVWAPIQGQQDIISGKKVVALDCGVKNNILRNLVESGCDVTVVPWNTTSEDILAHKPDGLFVSNGPGDPSAVNQTYENLKHVHGKLPIFGICLGHQLLSLSLGADTFKLKFGHRGGNQPVQNLGTGKVEITSQNHGFAVETESLKRVGGEPTHINLNDQTLEGFRHEDLAIFSVQYHPEAAPGPHDARYLFDCFINMMQSGKCPTAEEMDQAQRVRNTVNAGI